MRTNSGLDCKLLASYEEFQLDAAFNVADGELACIIGPSGCGKSTSLLLIAGLLPLEEGAIHLRGKDLSDTPTHKRNIAMVFQEYALFPHLSVGENIAYPLRRRKVGRHEREKRIAELLDLVSLSGYQRRRIDELSGGEQQRVALARALASEPDLLLLDEPLSALDAKLRIGLRDEIKRIHAETGITTVYVTHDQEEALSIADTIIVMDRGTVVQSGTPEEVYTEPKTHFVATFIGEGNTIAAASLLDEALPNKLLFFRPDALTITSAASIDETTHYSLSNATVVRSEFQGERYRIHLKWQTSELICYHHLPTPDTELTLALAKDAVRYF